MNSEAEESKIGFRFFVVNRDDGGRQNFSFCIFAEIDQKNVRKCNFFDFRSRFKKYQ